jgi:hypothetical protein
VNDEDCTEVDEQKKSGFNLFYLIGVYAIVKLEREYKLDDQSGRPLCCAKDARKQAENNIHVCYKGFRLIETNQPARDIQNNWHVVRQ